VPQEPSQPDQAQDAPAEDQSIIPAGLLLSVDSRGGYAVPRQLDGRIKRKR
jgi:hypothetical protein